MKKKTKKRRDRRARVFARRNDDEVVLAQRARVRVLLALVSANGGNKRMEFVNRDFHAATSIRRCAAPERSPGELARTPSVG